MINVCNNNLILDFWHRDKYTLIILEPFFEMLFFKIGRDWESGERGQVGEREGEEWGGYNQDTLTKVICIEHW